VKLVRRRNGDGGTDLVGCVLPGGRPRRLASSHDLETSTAGYTVRQVAGSIVLLGSSSGSQYGSETSVSVVSIRSGRRYLVARSCSRLGQGPCRGNATAPTAFVTARGRAVAALVAETSATTTIAAFSPRGIRTELDFGPSAQLPASSLRLSGTTASWTHSGEVRTATLART